MLFGDRVDHIDKCCDPEECETPVHKIGPGNGRHDVDPYKVSDSSFNNIKNPDSNVEGKSKNHVNDGKDELDKALLPMLQLFERFHEEIFLFLDHRRLLSWVLRCLVCKVVSLGGR